MEFTRKSLPERHYLYVEKECGYGPEIAEAMGAGFGAVFGFAGSKGITPLSMPMSLYFGMDPEVLRFRSAVIVSAEDAAKAADGISAGTLPAGDVMTTTHVGAYDAMNQTHQALWAHMEAEGIAGAFPIWEEYIDDPGDTAPEALRTAIFRMVA